MIPFGIFKRNILTRLSCAIPLDSTVVVTGGADPVAKIKASLYSENGWVKDLPDMLTHRWGHACGSYVNDHQQTVCRTTGCPKKCFHVSNNIWIIFGHPVNIFLLHNIIAHAGFDCDRG